MNIKHFAFAFVALAALSLAIAPTVAAHKTSYTTDGKVKIVWGFLNEPAVTWTKTGLDIVFTDNLTGSPILGAADTVEAHLKLGDQELHLDALAARFGTPGAYTQVVTLTRPGLYVLNLHGTINGSAVEMDITAQHEVHEIETTFFPATQESPFSEDEGVDPEVAALEARITALEAKIRTQAETPATLTEQPTATSPVPSASLLAVALAVVGSALILRRRK